MHDLRQTTLDLLDLVKTASGYPVVVSTNVELETTAALRMARGSVAVHTIEYNPDRASEPDYYIAVQGGLILRFFATPAVERRDLAYSARGAAAVRELVLREVTSRMPGVLPDAAAGFATQVYHGLMRQLRTMPIELRVEEWIRGAYPEFGEVQRAAVIRQLDENARVLTPAARSMSPARIFRATATMNAAVAQYWAGTYLLPDLVKPYSREGFASDGASLLAIWRQASSEATHDRELVDAWAQRLRVGGWYDWVPYDAPT